MLVMSRISPCFIKDKNKHKNVDGVRRSTVREVGEMERYLCVQSVDVLYTSSYQNEH